MKKFIIISSLFLIMIVASVGEILFTNHFYDDIIQLTNQLEESMLSNAETLNNSDTLDSLNSIEKRWHKGKDLVMMLSNHQVIRNADEKLVILGGYIKQNQKSDAFVSLEQYLEYIKHISKDNHPLFTNLF